MTEPVQLVVQPCTGVPSRRETAFPGSVSGARLYWLGQAGFVIDTPDLRIVIDPYLSDSLATKYRGRAFAHERMMPVPIEAEDLKDVDWVLSTHSHTDHLDPGTLPALARANPACRFLVPRSARAVALERGVPAERMVTCNCDDVVELHSPGCHRSASVSVLPAAHEQRQFDDEGNDLFLGYVIDLHGVTVYHSGDTIPFDALHEALAGRQIDAALLPVNGRDDNRRSNGVPGNLSLHEALELVARHDISVFIGHHFDMFDFNTIDREWGDRLIAGTAGAHHSRYLLAQVNRQYDIVRSRNTRTVVDNGRP